MVRMWQHGPLNTGHSLRNGNRFVEKRHQDVEAADCSGQASRVLLIDPVALTRSSLVHMFLSRCRDIRVDSSPDCLAVLADVPDLILINIHASSVEDARTQAIIALVRQTHDAEVPLAIIADLDEWELAIDAIHKFGLRGYISTSLKPEVAVAAARLMLAGGTFAPLDLPSVSQSRGAIADIIVPSSFKAAEELHLTYREADVLRLLQHGKPNKIIAFELDISESTVKVHVRNIMKKLHASNRTQVALLLRGTTPVEATTDSTIEV